MFWKTRYMTVYNFFSGFLFIYLFIYFVLFVFILFIYLLLERGETREKERKKNINVWLPLTRPPPPGVLACNPGKCPNWKSNLWSFGHRPVLSPLSQTSQGKTVYNLIGCIQEWETLY